MNTTSKTLTLLDIQSMSPEKIDGYFRHGFTLEDRAVSLYDSYQRGLPTCMLYGLQIPTTCDTYMSRVFSGVANKTIDWQKLPLMPGTLPNGSVGWFYIPDLLGSSGTATGVVFGDARDTTYNYQIEIFFNIGCCNTNPIKNCVCSAGAELCMAVGRFDKSLNLIDYTAPNGVIDYALSTLPFKGTNWLLVGGVTAGILAVYLAIRK